MALVYWVFLVPHNLTDPNFSPRDHLRYNPASFFLRCEKGSMEINPLLNALTDMKKRTDVLRGYL